MEFKFAYPVRFERAAEGGWVITCRDLPEVVSQADEDEDRIDIAEGALQAAFESRILLKEPFPAPSEKQPGEDIVAVPIETATKAALHMVVQESGESQVAAARRMKLDEKEVRRLLDPAHSSKVPRIAEAIASYGRRFQISVVDITDEARNYRATKRGDDEPKGTARGRKLQVSVEPRLGGKWAVQTDGTKRADSIHARKSDAVIRGRELAGNKHAELVVKTRVGRAAQKESHGNDPRRIKG